MTDIHPSHGLRGPAAHGPSADCGAQRWELPGTIGTGKRNAWAIEAEHNSGQGQLKWQGLTSSREAPWQRAACTEQISLRFSAESRVQARRAPRFRRADPAPAGAWGTAREAGFPEADLWAGPTGDRSCDELSSGTQSR